LKPENIVFDQNFDIKLIDFGLSQNFPRLKSIQNWKRCGTEDFAAPELYSSDPYDIKKIDLFALAVITFIMLTG